MMEITQVGMIGNGSMGGGLALLLASQGLRVALQDPSSSAMDAVIQSAKDEHISPLPTRHDDYESFCAALFSSSSSASSSSNSEAGPQQQQHPSKTQKKESRSQKVIFLSLPHGSVPDTVIDGLEPYLKRGDVILDCSNEHWASTERRQGRLLARGVGYVGMGVSGGYQAARRGPSLCPGGEEAVVESVMSLLKRIAARDDFEEKGKAGEQGKGRPCVGYVGTGGSGHYVKMIHNGIEHGMMSSVSEAWKILNTGLGMSYDEIGDLFSSWSQQPHDTNNKSNNKYELRNMFLIAIGAEICKEKDKRGHHVLQEVEDKVVQDETGEEGTGIWSNTQAIELHIPAPTLSTAHFLRVVSADRGQRKHVEATFHGSWTTPPTEFKFDYFNSKNDLSEVKSTSRKEFLEDLRLAVYTSCLVAYVQGLNIIDAADRLHGWDIDFSTVVQIWRAGCIIRSDHIADLLEEIYSNSSTSSSENKNKNRNLLYSSTIATEIKKGFPSLKRVVLKATECDAVIPSLSASLEYLKYAGDLELPTGFYEAELDYFGKHMFDRKGEGRDAPETGRHHFEWKPA